MPTLGLCVIAKNAAATLSNCLESVKGLMDAIVLVDTGSVDGTRTIAEQCGASVVSFRWNNDFAAARNAALNAMDTDWVLVLDADEELDADGCSWIRNELRAPRADGYVVPVRNYLPPLSEQLPDHILVPSRERHPRAPDASTYSHSEVCRLYRRSKDIYYKGHIHEQVEYRLMELGRPILRAGFHIHHFGWYLIDAEGLQRKYSLYSELLAEKLRQRPDDPQVMVQYGDSLCSWQGKAREGLEWFMRAAALEPEKHNVWTHIAGALLKLNQPEAALIAAERIREPAQAGRRAQLRGEALIALHRWNEALLAYREAARHYPEHLVITVQLASLEVEHGDREAGIAQLRLAAARAEREAEGSRHTSTTLRAAMLHTRLGQWERALDLLQTGLARDPDSLALLDLRLKAAVATERLDEAAEAAARIAELAPAPRSVLRHAAILNQNGNHAAALAAISCGLERFPLSDELQQAGRELGLGSVMAGAPA